MKLSAAVYDILDEEPKFKMPLPGHFVRFTGDDGNWIDVEVRDGRVTIRGSRALTIWPHSSNQFSVEVWR